MKERKIVVASLDEEYIDTIEYKLTEAFGNKASFEYITDKSYFDAYMKEPRNIDILLMDPEFLQEDIAKQNCRAIYFLTDHERVVEREEQKGNHNCVYKYSSIRALVDKMDHTLAYAGQGNSSIQTRYITVFSPMGNSGKTTVALGVADQLCRDGFKVLYLSTECLQDYQFFFDEMEPMPDTVGYQCAINMEQAAEILLTNLEQKNFALLKPFRKPLIAYQLNAEKMLQIAESIRKKNIYDYIVLEFSPEITMDKMNFLYKSDGVVLVARQEKMAVDKLYRFLQTITDWKGQCVVLCNHYDKDEKDYLAESRIAAQYPVSEYVEEQKQAIDYACLREKGWFEKTALAVR